MESNITLVETNSTLSNATAECFLQSIQSEITIENGVRALNAPWFSAVVIVLGIVFLLWGARFGKYVLIVIVAVVTGALSLEIIVRNELWKTMNCTVAAVLCICISLVAGGLAWALLSLAIFLAGAVTGAIASHYVLATVEPWIPISFGNLLGNTLFPYWASMLVCAVGTGIISVYKRKNMLSIITSTLGAFGIVWGTNNIVEIPDVVSAILIAVLGICGSLIQIHDVKLLKLARSVCQRNRQQQSDERHASNVVRV